MSAILADWTSRTICISNTNKVRYPTSKYLYDLACGTNPLWFSHHIREDTYYFINLDLSNHITSLKDAYKNVKGNKGGRINHKPE